MDVFFFFQISDKVPRPFHMVISLGAAHPITSRPEFSHLHLNTNLLTSKDKWQKAEGESASILQASGNSKRDVYLSVDRKN